MEFEFEICFAASNMLKIKFIIFISESIFHAFGRIMNISSLSLPVPIAAVMAVNLPKSSGIQSIATLLSKWQGLIRANDVQC
jgi:hypothetical protein